MGDELRALLHDLIEFAGSANHRLMLHEKLNSIVGDAEPGADHTLIEGNEDDGTAYGEPVDPTVSPTGLGTSTDDSTNGETAS